MHDYCEICGKPSWKHERVEPPAMMYNWHTFQSHFGKGQD